MQLSELMDDSIDQCKSVDIEIQWQLPSTIFFLSTSISHIGSFFANLTLHSKSSVKCYKLKQS